MRTFAPCKIGAGGLDILTSDTATKTIDWTGHVVPFVKQLLERDYTTFKPTIRGVFYRAGSEEIIPLTQPAYKGLVKALSVARKNGIIPMNAFTDNSRHIIDIHEQYWEPIHFVKDLVDELRNLPKIYHYTIPRWHNQPHYVEIFVEKDAVVGTFQELLNDKQVRIVPNRGWSSLTYKFDNINRLLTKKREGKVVRVLYFGDYDPTGLRMSYNLEQDFRGYGIHFERIALTKSQIVDFGLDHLKNPDPQVLEKLRRDPNSKAFARENGSLYQIETDALQKDPKKLRKLVHGSVDQYFNEQIYENSLNEFTPQYIRQLVRKRVQFIPQ
jgi:hypothetical protein